MSHMDRKSPYKLDMAKLLQIELNEFNVEFLRDYSNKFDLKSILYFLDLNRTELYTDEEVEHLDLDPWVQWVSVHTGQAFSKHKIGYLGEGPINLSYNQTWDVLVKNDVSAGIWGAMNAKFIEHKSIKFFLPDPWCFEFDSKPSILNKFMSPVACYARNYGAIKFKEIFPKCLNFLVFFVQTGGLQILIKNFRLLTAGIRHIKHFNVILFALFDLISVEIFIRLNRRYSPDYSVIFINCVAHLQHHHWEQKEGNNINLFVLRIVDSILEKLRRSEAGNGSLILTNGFSQKFEYDDYYCYAVIDIDRFFRDIQLDRSSYVTGMTDDVLVTFDCPQICAEFLDVIKRSTVNGERVFSANYSMRSDRIISFRISIKHRLDQEAKLYISGKRLNFFDYFKVIANRTGSHVPVGSLFADGIKFPRRIRNDEIHDYVLQYFGVKE